MIKVRPTLPLLLLLSTHVNLNSMEITHSSNVPDPRITTLSCIVTKQTVSDPSNSLPDGVPSCETADSVAHDWRTRSAESCSTRQAGT